MSYLILTPAYGRDYKSAKEAKEAFLAGKDFVVNPQGCYCSIRDLAPGQSVNIRYKNLRQVMVLKVTEEMKNAQTA